VTTGGPAAKAGFKQGDVILSFNGHEIDKVRDLPIVVAATSVGQKADVKVWRKDGETTLTAEIAALPDNPQVAKNDTNGGAPSAPSSSAMGLKLAPLTNELRQQLHLGKDVKGVVVTAVADSSPLADLGLRRGDVIESINQQPTLTPKEVSDLLAHAKSAKGGTNVLMLINRNGVNQYVALSLSNEDKG
jgi:serine protease Do